MNAPTVRLAFQVRGNMGRRECFVDSKRARPDLRLAVTSGGIIEAEARSTAECSVPPALLVSYVYVEPFMARRQELRCRDWMLDSGAYSAWNSGTPIVLADYIRACFELREKDPQLTEIIALDVIGDGRGSLENALAMKRAGLEVIPVFHVGDDRGILAEYVGAFEKVGLSCRFGEPLVQSFRFYDDCFARHWPHKFHSFGWVSERMLMRYPFHSSDCSSWEMGPTAFGNWKAYGKLSVRGSKQNLRCEVEWYLELEARLRQRWKREMEVLECAS